MQNIDLSILLVVEGDIATTQLIEQLLSACSRFGVSYQKVYLKDLGFRHLNQRRIPLLVRCGDPDLPPWIEWLRSARHPYLYYIDDNFWELQDDSPVGAYYCDPSVRRSLEFVVSNAYEVLTNSEVLAAYLCKYSGRVRVLPPFFDFDLIKECLREETPELRIGFAGSQGRAVDLDLIRPAIQPVLDRVPNAVFEFCGAMPRDVQQSNRIRFFAHTNSYPNFIRFLATRNWAIGMAPLHDTPANRAKTNNKYREYGACGIPGVYSDMPPYRGSVDPGVTGLLVDPSCDAWVAAMLRLALHSADRARIAAQAEKDVREKYSIELVAAHWHQCMRKAQESLLEHPSYLLRSYLLNTALPTAMREIRMLWLQVHDAHRRGGLRLVLSKSAQRLSFGRAGDRGDMSDR